MGSIVILIILLSILLQAGPFVYLPLIVVADPAPTSTPTWTATPTPTHTVTPTFTPTWTPTERQLARQLQLNAYINPNEYTNKNAHANRNPNAYTYANPTQPSYLLVILPNTSHYVSGSYLYVIGEVYNGSSSTVRVGSITANFFDVNGGLVDTRAGLVYLTYIPAGEKTCFTVCSWNRQLELLRISGPQCVCQQCSSSATDYLQRQRKCYWCQHL